VTGISSLSTREALYVTVRTIRRFEEEVVALVDANEIPGVTHEYIGEEAIAAGVCAALRPDDAITSTHRGHGHLIARGASLRAMLAELLGRESGTNQGRGGSMHVADLSRGILGANGIVAAGAPIAAGAAWAALQAGDGAVAVTFFGDGGINQGVLAETMNLASLWRLPLLFVCENNGYGEYTPMAAVTAGEIIARATAMEIPARIVDGMDIRATRAAALEVVAQVRGGGGPVFVEARTYRFVGHSRSDPGRYRPEGELDRWRERDPLTLAQVWLREHLDDAERRIAEVNDSVVQEMARIEASALAAPFPQPAAVTEFK